MKPIAIFKVGGTFAHLARQLGDFEHWFLRAIEPLGQDTQVFQVAGGTPLPDPASLAGVIITGSHAMVTDAAPWSVALEGWLREAVAARLPILGVCYGHQLLAQALGGEVGYLAPEPEVGTVALRLTPEAAADPLLGGLPDELLAHATHAQTVQRLPAGAVLLASSPSEPHHAVRFAEGVWGVQFHPEFDRHVMAAYVDYRASRCQDPGRDWPSIRSAITDTPLAAQVLHRFVTWATRP